MGEGFSTNCLHDVRRGLKEYEEALRGSFEFHNVKKSNILLNSLGVGDNDFIISVGTNLFNDYVLYRWKTPDSPAILWIIHVYCMLIYFLSCLLKTFHRFKGCIFNWNHPTHSKIMWAVIIDFTLTQRWHLASLIRVAGRIIHAEDKTVKCAWTRTRLYNIHSLKHIIFNNIDTIFNTHMQLKGKPKATKMPEVLTLSGLADAEPDLSTFENKTGLAEDMKFLASMPELCDVTFLVGETREPVCAVKVRCKWHILNRIKLISHVYQAVLASRSRVFQKMLYHAPSPQRKKDPPPRENKLRLFLKRSSEPLLNLQNAAQQVNWFVARYRVCYRETWLYLAAFTTNN